MGTLTLSGAEQTGAYSTDTLWLPLAVVWGSFGEVWLTATFLENGELTRDDTRNIPLNPPLFNSIALELTWLATAGADLDGTISVFFVPEPDPVIYAGGALPNANAGQRGELIVYSEDYENYAGGDTISLDLGSTTGTATAAILEGPSGTGMNPRETGNYSANLANLRSQINNANWNGRICFTIHVEPTTGTSRFEGSTAGSQTTTLVGGNFHTGQNTGRTVRDRIRHCPRSGLPAYTDEFVRDGYHEGTWVLADWHEPEDRVGMDNNIPPDEGVIKDEVA